MKWFKNNNSVAQTGVGNAVLAEMALNYIHDAVMIVDGGGVVRYLNPAAVTMLGVGVANNAVGLDYGLLIKLESKDGRALTDAESPLAMAMKTGQPLERYEGVLIAADKKTPIALTVLPVEQGNRIITFRDITKELEEDGAQMEFISTASHEMRTPVASIEGYLSLAINPQTATIDERARGYLEAAHQASQHLGKLFQDLLDTTKLDDGKMRANLVPVELIGAVKQLADSYIPQMTAAKLKYQFGGAADTMRKVAQVAYAMVDLEFLREIIGNLVENAIKYTPEGGAIYVNALGDGDRVLINVTDTGMGIGADDLQHIFQKFYRADNSDTRTIGGTGLGLYLVKQRVEAMGGKVWAESAFGEGSTFYVSLPRITGEEYEKQMIAYQNNNPNGGIK